MKLKNLTPIGLRVGQPIFNKAFQKDSIVVDCCILLSSLFHSDIVDGKKECLKTSVLL